MRERPFIVVTVVVTALLLGAVGLYAYDATREDRIAEGVRVAGVDVGGMSSERARAVLERTLLPLLDRTLTVRAGERTFHLTAREARVGADLTGMVDEALRAGRGGSILARTVRSLTGGRVDAEIAPRLNHSGEAVTRLLVRVRRAIDRPARDATVDFSPDGVGPVPSHDGRRVDTAALRREVEAALAAPGVRRELRARVRRVAPKITTGELGVLYPYVIVVNRGAFRLRLFRNLRLVKTYRIAVGQIGLETPAGLYRVQNKAVNPAWRVPNHSWAGKLAGKVIPPGPENPIKARWLGIYAGAGIHGTDAIASLGRAASHGCIRMAIPDVVELYDQVPVQTPVYIS